MPIGIVGYGTVGQATAALFKDVAIYDPPQGYSDISFLQKCPVLFACLPTPTGPQGQCDLSAIYHAMDQIAPILSEKQTVAIRSTVPPGTVRQLQEGFPHTHFASNPEFLRSHRAKEDSRRPWRIVIGADSVYPRQSLLKVYHSRFKERVAYLVTDSLTAEFIKYAANCFLATKITYAQEVRNAASRLGAHYDDVVHALSLDPRICGGDEWWSEGLVDECLPKDLEAFVNWLRQHQIARPLLDSVLWSKNLDLTPQRTK